MTSLRESAMTGVRWTAISATFATVTALLFQLIKARFLVPEEFAHLSILMIIIGLSRNLEAAGFNRGVIQKDAVSSEEASSLLVFNIAISLFAAGVIYFASGTLATFFELPRLGLYFRIMSLAVFFQGPAQFFIVFLEKYLHFKFISIIQIVRQFLFVTMATILIVMGWGVLGFVLGHVVATIISAFLFAAGGLKNHLAALKPYFGINELRPFVKFGIFVTGRQTLNVVTRQLDELIILHFLGPEIMGVYFFGKNMLERLRQLVNMSYYRLVFPLLSRLKHDQERLSEAYYRMSRYLSLLAFPVFIGVSLTAHLFVPVVFGEQWTDSIIVFQVFSVVFIFKILTGILAGNLLYSVNQPGTVFKLDLLTDLVYVSALILLAPWGIDVVIVLYVIYQLLKALAMQIAAHRHLSYQIYQYVSNFSVPLALSLVMVLAVLGFQFAAAPLLNPAMLLAGSIVVGALVYAVMTWLFDKQSVKDFREMVLYRSVG
ncbi:MAG: oligosaccharide flippase family protein [Bacillota bacterium]